MTLPHPSSAITDLPLAAAADGVRIAVRLTPRAAADRIGGIVAEAGGGPALKVSVTAPPAENRANDALLQLLAREWRLPRRDLSLAASGKSRSKSVHVHGDPGALLARLGPLVSGLPRR